jgi:plasmid replication initiation protein
MGVFFFFSPFFVNIAKKTNMDIEKYADKFQSKNVLLAIDLVQPNKVTNARYSFTEREENVLTLMIDALQKHMTRERPIQTDLFGEPIIIINTQELGDKSKAKYITACKSITKKDFSFEWKREDGKLIKTMGVLATTVHDVQQTPYIEITINKWAIPYLLYWGKEVGGTIFSKATALKLPGNYTKRLYKLCKRWEDKNYFSMPLDELREMLMLEEKYNKIKDLKKWVLDPAAERMKEMADVFFTYKLEKVAGSRSYNYIHFIIHSNEKNRATGKKSEVYMFVYNMLNIAYPNYISSAAKDIADKLSENPERLEMFYQRLKKLKNELDTGQKEIEDVIRLIKHILKADYGIAF